MKRILSYLPILALLCAALTACDAIGEKSASLTTVYAVTMGLSLLLLVGYLCLVQKRQLWFILLFASVFVVDLGYFTLSVSTTLEEALLANRIAYLGSVLLPMAMLMIILGVTELRHSKWLPGLLLAISLAVFAVAASPGYLTIYYRDVRLEIVDGVAVLKKEYGSWHCLYLYFLILYFAAMIAVTVHAAVSKKLASPTHALVLCTAVVINLGVWLLEQLVSLDLEFLSVSYIITELFLLGLHMMVQENYRRMAALQSLPPEPAIQAQPADPDQATSEEEQCQFFLAHLPMLTPTERIIFDLYLEGKTSKDILVDQNIKENTLKYHNRNIYSKLGVSSRKQLLQVAAAARYIKE